MANASSENAVPTNNTANGEWELTLNGYQSILAYELSGDRIVYLHTEVPEELEGHGVASTLAKAALDDARAQHQTVVPLCPFVLSYIKRHPEYQDLVDHSHRQAR